MSKHELGDAAADESLDLSVPLPAVQLSGISKRFDAVVACDSVDLALERGRIHGLLGENGAGKSTLMKMLIGLVVPDAGTIAVDGVARLIPDPLAAAALGIGMVHQHFSLVDALTVWENVALGSAGRFDPNATRSRIAELADRYGLVIDPDKRVGDLTAGLRQRVEIVKCLYRNPSIVIFDEPTSVLTPEESEQLFASLRQVVATENRAVVLVSHKLDEVLHASDDITVMRQGKVVDQRCSVDSDAAILARAMVGREVSLRRSLAAPVSAEPSFGEPEQTEPLLRIANAVAHDASGVVVLGDFSLDVFAGEIVGVAGVEGNGQQAITDLFSSLLTLRSGTVTVEGAPVPTGKAGAMAKAGIGVVGADRHESDLVLEMSVAENLMLIDQSPVATHGLIDQKRLNEFAQEMIAQFNIACSGPNAPMWSLSGGNQQRVVLARELALQPKMLVAAQPTRGLDVGAIEYVSGRLRSVASAGMAVLLVSSELDEILELSHRIIVLARGRVIAELARAEANIETLGLLLAGAP